MITFKEENRNRIKQIISKISCTENIDKILPLVIELASLTKGYPICKICGKPLHYQIMKFSIKENNILYIETPTPKTFEQIFNGNKFTLNKCYSCIKEHFEDDMPSMQRYLFMLRYRWAKWIYDINEELHEQIRSDKCGVTLKSLIRKWGKEDGEKRWKEYCRRQGEVNTFEYKQHKYGWTKEQFDEFNKSRACTIENFIERYGEEIGNKKWKEYLNKQHETKSWEYMVEKFGEVRAKEINKSKAITIENLTKKYGFEEAKSKYLEWINRENHGIKYYSEISQELFDQIRQKIKYKCQYAEFDGEHLIFDNTGKHVYSLDFYIPDLKLCVEYDGDIFHANPSKYIATDVPIPWKDNTITAQQIWDYDKERQEFIESQGIKVIRIWDSEYQSKEFNINKFITEKMGIELK